MKIILPLILLAVLASCGPSKYLECPKYVGVAINADSLPPCGHRLPNCKCLRIRFYDSLEKAWGTAPDTTCEWMHISVTRGKGFVIARKALSVRVDGYCTAHLDCAGKPFPAHYHVGWCEGKEALLNRLVKGRAK